jgi:hypothetical protein
VRTFLLILACRSVPLDSGSLGSDTTDTGPPPLDPLVYVDLDGERTWDFFRG